MAKQTSTHKLGTSKRIERSRIWLQGKRLTAAGFTPGKTFYAVWAKGKLTLDLRTHFPDDYEERKVSGKGEMPIIDIVGASVRETFGHRTHVDVEYQQGRITITPSK